MTLSLPIPTDRLLLRLMQSADLKRFAAYRADPVLARYQGWSPMTEDEARAFIAEMGVPPALGTGLWHQIAMADRTSGELLGDIGLCSRENGEVELGFTLMHEAQGQGFATESIAALARELFRHAEVACIVAETDERNRASIRVLERVGMTLVDRREAVFKQESCVELRYVLTRPAP